MSKMSHHNVILRLRTPGKTFATAFVSIFAVLIVLACFSSDPAAGFIATGIAVFIARRHSRKSTLMSRRAFEASCETHSVEYKATYSDPQRQLFLGLSEVNNIVLAQIRISDLEVREMKFDVKNVLNIELKVGDHAVFRSGPLASLSGASVGGLAFGGAGAIVGSLTSGQVGRGKLGSIVLQLRLDDIDNPVLNIPFLIRPAKSSSADVQARLALAEKWTHLIEVMRSRLLKAPAAATHEVAAA
jgi:hypothetical protein